MAGNHRFRSACNARLVGRNAPRVPRQENSHSAKEDSSWAEDEQDLYSARNGICNLHENRQKVMNFFEGSESVEQAELWMQEQGIITYGDLMKKSKPCLLLGN